LELEVSDIDYKASLLHSLPVPCVWVHDGSVHPSEQELVTDPSAGDLFLKLSLKICQMLFPHSECNRTCGLHVHVSAVDYNAFDLRRLLTLYSLCENTFYSLVAPWRQAEKVWMHKYCRRLDENDQFVIKALWKTNDKAVLKRAIIYWMYPNELVNSHGDYSDFHATKSNKYQKCRYRGLNLHTWFERKTVEFRHHEGTLDPGKIIGWSLFCGWLVELAAILPDSVVQSTSDFGDLLRRMPSGVSEYVRRTLADNAAGNVADPPEPMPGAAIKRLERGGTIYGDGTVIGLTDRVQRTTRAGIITGTGTIWANPTWNVGEPITNQDEDEEYLDPHPDPDDERDDIDRDDD
jgi:hypothetical protein